jgi:hypothetical protein
MPFTHAFQLCDVVERCDAALPKIIDPSPGLGDSTKQGIAALTRNKLGAKLPRAG